MEEQRGFGTHRPSSTRACGLLSDDCSGRDAQGYDEPPPTLCFEHGNYRMRGPLTPLDAWLSAGEHALRTLAGASVAARP